MDLFARLLYQLPDELVDVEISGTDPVEAFRRYETELAGWLADRYPGHSRDALRALEFELIDALGLSPSVWFDALSDLVSDGHRVYRPIHADGVPDWILRAREEQRRQRHSDDVYERSGSTERAAPAAPTVRMTPTGLVARIGSEATTIEGSNR